tara:strand:+ start:1735 stop:1860 length:126 start_codon:yes stop_codon:yes gene_type:complete
VLSRRGIPTSQSTGGVSMGSTLSSYTYKKGGLYKILGLGTG